MKVADIADIADGADEADITDGDETDGDVQAARRGLGRESGSRALLLTCAGLTVIGVVLRVAGALRPFDQPGWRRADLVAIARGFWREDGNILHPRVAWRGVTSGVVEGEFPLVSWLNGMAFRVFGEHDRLLVVLPLMAGLVSLGVIGWMVRHEMGSAAAGCAVAVMALNPLHVFVSSSVQSDSLMLLGVVTAVAGSLRWVEEPHLRRWPLLTSAGLVLGGLMKLTALHVGLVVAFVIISTRGRGWLRRRDVRLVTVAGTVITALWSLYARHVFLRTGLSLGVSNETHWAGTELFTQPHLVKGMVVNEVRYVWVWFAPLPALAGAWWGWRHRLVRVCIAWLFAVGIMLLLAGRTTGDGWAFYYHVPAVPPVAILVAVGLVEAVARWRRREGSALAKRAVCLGVIGLAAATVTLGAGKSWQQVQPVAPSPPYRCAQTFASVLPRGDLILASGGIRLDDGGHRVAYDASYMFEWLDAFGWTIAIEDQTVATVAVFAQRGARWFVAERDALSQAQLFFEAELRARYGLAASCDAALLFDLRTERGSVLEWQAPGAYASPEQP